MRSKIWSPRGSSWSGLTVSETWRRILDRRQLTTPEGWSRIKTIDLHTAGEPLRVVVDGFPPIEGDSVLACRRYVREQYDHLRTALMFEPRGHADMYGCILLPPVDPESDFGILFMHNEGYSTMCGHAIIGVATLAVRMGWVNVRESRARMRIDAPCGPITAFAEVDGDSVTRVAFHCVPSFVAGLDRAVRVAGLGEVTYDLAYGGAFYAYVQSEPLGIPLVPESYRELIEAGMAIKRAVMETDTGIRHPLEEDLSFLYGTIFVGGPITPGVDSRNVCVFAEGEVDRSPTGSGVSGRMAIHFSRGELGVGSGMRIESILGTVFEGAVVREVACGPHRAVIPSVTGTAHIVGQNEWLIDPDDPLKEGFILR
jgi:trans-L-3-hydroxyproline dehydratase